MRDAQAHAVADLGCIGFFALVPTQVGMLVVQRGDLPAGGHTLRLQRAARRACDRHGQRKVEGDVTLADRQDRQARLGPRLHVGPDFHCRGQAFAALAAQALVHHAHHALVEAMVVRDIAARAQQAAHRRTQRRLQAPRHEVEDGRAAGRDQHLVGLKQLLRVAVARHGFDAVHQRGGVGRVGLALARGALPFVGLDAHELGRVARAHPRGERNGFVVRAAARARALHADLEHHLERHARGIALGPVFNERQLRDRIDQEHDAQVRMVGQQQLDACQVFVAHHLVGDERAARACGHAHGQLRDGREGQAPGAGVELALEQLRRHGGLAMRRQVDAPLAHARLHPREVVLQRLALEHGQRQRQVAGQHVPAGGTDFTAPARRLGARVALEAVAEQRVDEVLGSRSGVGHGRATAMLESSSLRMQAL